MGLPACFTNLSAIFRSFSDNETPRCPNLHLISLPLGVRACVHARGRALPSVCQCVEQTQNVQPTEYGQNRCLSRENANVYRKRLKYEPPDKESQNKNKTRFMNDLEMQESFSRWFLKIWEKAESKSLRRWLKLHTKPTIEFNQLKKYVSIFNKFICEKPPSDSLRPIVMSSSFLINSFVKNLPWTVCDQS